MHTVQGVWCLNYETWVMRVGLPRHLGRFDICGVLAFVVEWRSLFPVVHRANNRTCQYGW